MKNIFTIVKKEFSRFFGDRRMVLTTLVLPGLMIYLVYSFMGSAITNMMTVDENYVPVIYTINMPESIGGIVKQSGIETKPLSENELDGIKNSITEMGADLCVIFPKNFDESVAEYDAQTSSVDAPNVEIFYNSASTESATMYMRITAILDSYESSLANKFDVNGNGKIYDLVTEQDASGSFLASMLPMLLIMFLFSGCMAIAPESIAGEKERGTIATLLITPIKRSELAIGKILSLAAIAFMCGLSSALGTILSLPKLMGDADGISMNIYGTNDYLLLGLTILSTILVIISVLAIISAYAKTIKEATSIVMPLMIVVMLVGVSSMFGGGAQTDITYYLIPLYNSVQCMSGILSLNYVTANIMVTVISNLVYTLMGAFALTRMFNSEKIIFTK